QVRIEAAGPHRHHLLYDARTRRRDGRSDVGEVGAAGARAQQPVEPALAVGDRTLPPVLEPGLERLVAVLLLELAVEPVPVELPQVHGAGPASHRPHLAPDADQVPTAVLTER